ncbi:MAG: hypothetical protein KDA75_04590 [Planctomycetaceae bacterium]|nr:hypothetical protein [Planctomycetaceae bacterium]
MSTTLLQRRSIRIPLQLTSYTVCILHKGRWCETPVSKPFDDVLDMAEDAYRRSGLPVQVRDADRTILFEANDEGAKHCMD